MQSEGARFGRRSYDYYSGPNVPSEFYWSRLQYTSGYASGSSYGFRGFRGGWSRDYPKADNDCLIALRRLTRINSPSPLNVADLDSDHIFDYPWIYAVDVNTWTFTDEEAKRLHDYLLKGGFLMVDDFHGTDDWEHFMAGMRRCCPTGPWRISRMTTRSTTSCTTSTKSFRSPARSTSTPAEPMRRTATCPSGAPSATTTGASWWPSAPTCIWATPGSGPTAREYPEKFSGLAFRIVLNYITYSMTH